MDQERRRDGSLLVGIVGPCSAGKSTLGVRLRGDGYRVSEIAQEHSAVPDMWQRMTNPDVLVYLDVSMEVAARREGLSRPSSWWPAEREVRLAHARAHCDLYVDTTPLTPDDVYERVRGLLPPLDLSLLSARDNPPERGETGAERGGRTDMMQHVLGLVGRSGCGKTTLITQLIPVLGRRGISVGVIKHSPVHDVESDVPGTDTHRYWMAGARHVSLVARDRVVHTHRFEAEPELETALAGFYGVDLVLLEGYKRVDVDKIEVIRAACDPAPIAGLGRRIACVTDVPHLDLACPEFGLRDYVAIAGFVARWLMRE